MTNGKFPCGKLTLTPNCVFFYGIPRLCLSLKEIPRGAGKLPRHTGSNRKLTHYATVRYISGNIFTTLIDFLGTVQSVSRRTVVPRLFTGAVLSHAGTAYIPAATPFSKVASPFLSAADDPIVDEQARRSRPAAPPRERRVLRDVSPSRRPPTGSELPLVLLLVRDHRVHLVELGAAN